jgi:hypothetical protein
MMDPVRSCSVTDEIFAILMLNRSELPGPSAICQNHPNLPKRSCPTVRCFHVDAATNMRNVLPVARVLLVFEHEVQRL